MLHNINGTVISHYSYNGLEINVFVCNVAKYLHYRVHPYDWTGKLSLKIENHKCSL